MEAREREMIRIQAVVTEIHRELSERMLTDAKAVAKPLGARIVYTTRVPGSLEVPLAVQQLLAVRSVDAVVILGMIQKGKTKHGEVLAHAVTSELLRLQLKYEMPMAVAIIGPDATPEHAEGKAKATAEKAMRVAVRMVQVLRELRQEGRKRKKHD